MDAAPTIAERLSHIPGPADAALIIRHAEREGIPTGEFGVDIPLTARGVAEAERLGEALICAGKEFRVVSSPVPRCVQTGKAILRGAGCPGGVALDRRLGDPGPFVVDTDAGGHSSWKSPYHELCAATQQRSPCPGMRQNSGRVEILLSLTADELENNGRLSDCTSPRAFWRCCWPACSGCH